jgi:hypothetical protein
VSPGRHEPFREIRVILRIRDSDKDSPGTPQLGRSALEARFGNGIKTRTGEIHAESVILSILSIDVQ